tara:strand:+ start:4411 stop:4752 length:342 start_codon:yes stop_codon:yes gene_type:complete
MGIEIIKKADIVRSAPECFRAQCAHWPHDTDRMAITEKLLALDLDTITAEQVDGIIGNTSWTKNKCDECDQDCEVLARFGPEPDYDVRWFDVCLSCLTQALEAAKEAALVGKS